MCVCVFFLQNNNRLNRSAWSLTWMVGLNRHSLYMLCFWEQQNIVNKPVLNLIFFFRAHTHANKHTHINSRKKKHERYHDNIGSRSGLFFLSSSPNNSCPVARTGCRLDKALAPAGKVRRLAVVWLMRFMSYARYLYVVGLMSSDLFLEMTGGFFWESACCF